MDEHKEFMQTIPYIAYESSQARNERLVKRLILVLVIVTSMLFASNLWWAYEWMSYDYVETEEEIVVDGDDRGNANYIGNDGDIINGKDNR